MKKSIQDEIDALKAESAVELIHKYELDAEGIYKKVKAFAK